MGVLRVRDAVMLPEDLPLMAQEGGELTSEEVALAWLRFAFGDAVAHDVMLLPAGLRESLYGDVLRWSPAGNEIQAFLVALRGKHGAASEEDLFPLSEIYDVAFTVADGNPAVVYLAGALDMVGSSYVWADGDAEWLVTFAALALSSPWFPESLPQFAPYVPHMNELLCRLGLLPMPAVVGEYAHA